jgi:hypothetical protein
MSLKNPVTQPGIDPGTVRLVAQHLNHYATPGPPCRLWTPSKFCVSPTRGGTLDHYYKNRLFSYTTWREVNHSVREQLNF